MNSDAVCPAPQGLVRSGERVPGRGEPALQAIGISTILGAGVFLALTSLRLPLVCPLRLLTGVPCPLCGMTSGTVSVLRGDLHSAMLANPFSLPFVAGLITLISYKLKAVFAGGQTSKVRGLPHAHRSWIVVAALILAASLSWVFQLSRFGLI